MPDEPLPPRVRAYLVDDDNFDVLQELVLSYDKTWQEQLNGEGYGSLKLPMFEVGANPGLAQLPYSGGTITGGDIGASWLVIDGELQAHPYRSLWVRFELDGIPAFSMKVEQAEGTYVSPSEDVGREVTITGRGPLGRLEGGLVLPYHYDDRYSFSRFFPWSKERIFNAHTPELDDSGWATPPVSIASQDGVAGLVPSPWEGYPSGFPDPYAWWVWSELPDGSGDNPDGDVYFRYHFNSPGDAYDKNIYAVFIACDNECEIWLDGIKVTEINGGEDDAREGWTNTTRFDFQDHAYTFEGDLAGRIISMKATNSPLASGGVNPGGLIMTVFAVPAIGSPDIGDPSQGLADGGNLVGKTGGSLDIRMLPRPAVAPYFTPGQILRILIEENQRFNLLTQWSWTFTDTTDSSGAAWDEDLRLFEQTFQIGRTILDVLKQMAESQIDFSCDVTGYVLHVWNKGSNINPVATDLSVLGTFGTVRAIALEAAVNLTEASTKVMFQEGSLVLIESAEGWTESWFGDGPTKASLLSLGDISRDNALVIGNAVASRAEYSTVTLTAAIEPTSYADTPYHSFFVGDWLTVDSAIGTVEAPIRLVSLSVSEDSQGDPTFVTEFMTISEDLEERFGRWLNRMSIGGAGGRSSSASPVTVIGQIGSRGQVDEQSLTFSQEGLIDTMPDPPDTPAYVISARGVITSFNLSCLVAGDGDTTLELKVNGTTISTVTLEAGDTRRADLGINHLCNPGDEVYLTFLAVGNCENLTAHPKYTAL